MFKSAAKLPLLYHICNPGTKGVKSSSCKSRNTHRHNLYDNSTAIMKESISQMNVITHNRDNHLDVGHTCHVKLFHKDIYFISLLHERGNHGEFVFFLFCIRSLLHCTSLRCEGM